MVTLTNNKEKKIPPPPLRGYTYPQLGYINNVVLANYACSNLCPDIVFIPKNEKEVSDIIKYAVSTNQSISILGGGHSYTCSSVKCGGVLINMKKMSRYKLVVSEDHQLIDQGLHHFIDIGAGAQWKQIIPYLTKNGLITVHGQCTSVGVAGFTLNGGVHFGGLSNIFGLASENIISATIVLSNGSIVISSPGQCVIDDAVSIYHCDELLRALRGAGGSSLGVVTSLRLQAYLKPMLHSYLCVLSLDITDPNLAAAFVIAYFNNLPNHISVTLFGLDAFFKSYIFAFKFSHSKLSFLSQLRSKNRSKNLLTVHFVVEVSWPAEDNDSTITDIQIITNNLISSFQDNLFSPSFTTYTSTGGQLWSVQSYVPVWGHGHRYGGASVTVSKKVSEIYLATVFNDYKFYITHKSCSDCVMVIHRLSDRVRNTNFSSTSINPVLGSSYIWIELDCGHFARSASSWPMCNSFLKRSQRSIDALDSPDFPVYHYPNVPSLFTTNWTEKYYGRNIKWLQMTKLQFDPSNIFHHRQSILADSHSIVGTDNLFEQDPLVSSRCQRTYALKLGIDVLGLSSKGLIISAAFWVTMKFVKLVKSFLGNGFLCLAPYKYKYYFN